MCDQAVLAHVWTHSWLTHHCLVFWVQVCPVHCFSWLGLSLRHIVEFLSRRLDLSLVSIMAQAVSLYIVCMNLVIVPIPWNHFLHSIITEGTNKCLLRISSFLQDSYNSIKPRREIFWYWNVEKHVDVSREAVRFSKSKILSVWLILLSSLWPKVYRNAWVGLQLSVSHNLDFKVVLLMWPFTAAVKIRKFCKFWTYNLIQRRQSET